MSIQNKNSNSDNSKGLSIGFMFFFISFALIIIISELSREPVNFVKYEEEIPPTHITSYGTSLRGAIAYKKKHIFSSSSGLVENKRKYKPIIENAIIQKRPEIFDLDFPYTVSKKKNSDTLIVEKDGYILKFLITEW